MGEFNSNGSVIEGLSVDMQDDVRRQRFDKILEELVEEGEFIRDLNYFASSLSREDFGRMLRMVKNSGSISQGMGQEKFEKRVDETPKPLGEHLTRAPRVESRIVQEERLSWS